VGAEVRDVISGERFTVRAKSVLFCGGSFTDELRRLEDKKAANLVTGAAGIHVVLNNTFAPPDMGMLDMATSGTALLTSQADSYCQY
jgi:glycerol-3-phosphate dehydrogenase